MRVQPRSAGLTGCGRVRAKDPDPSLSITKNYGLCVDARPHRRSASGGLILNRRRRRRRALSGEKKTMDNSEITILNVDGSEVGLYAKSRILREAGYIVIEARTGRGAAVGVRFDSNSSC